MLLDGHWRYDGTGEGATTEEAAAVAATTAGATEGAELAWDGIFVLVLLVAADFV